MPVPVTSYSPFSNTTQHKAFQPAYHLLASSYHSCSSTSIFLSSFLATFLHLFCGSHLGRDCGSQLNSITSGSLWSGILTKLPSHYNHLFYIFTLTVSASPHPRLTLAVVMCSDHYCLLEMSKMVLSWKKFSRFPYCLSGIQHSIQEDWEDTYIVLLCVVTSSDPCLGIQLYWMYQISLMPVPLFCLHQHPSSVSFRRRIPGMETPSLLSSSLPPAQWGPGPEWHNCQQTDTQALSFHLHSWGCIV